MCSATGMTAIAAAAQLMTAREVQKGDQALILHLREELKEQRRIQQTDAATITHLKETVGIFTDRIAELEDQVKGMDTNIQQQNATVRQLQSDRRLQQECIHNQLGIIQDQKARISEQNDELKQWIDTYGEVDLALNGEDTEVMSQQEYQPDSAPDGVLSVQEVDMVCSDIAYQFKQSRDKRDITTGQFMAAMNALNALRGGCLRRVLEQQHGHAMCSG